MSSGDPARPMQDLKSFKLPPGFRGRSALWVQLWWIVEAVFFGMSPQVAYGWRRWLLRQVRARGGAGGMLRPPLRTTYPWEGTIRDHALVRHNVMPYRLGE